jgi:NAD(P)-dependent dehydrogenase (short-subunit alcohol dehydrogenase family)
VCNITSQLGSIGNNTGGSSYGYRASKAALNQMNRSLAAELAGEGFKCLAVHPGWVRTDMGGPNATLSVEESTRQILSTIGRAGAAENGGFFNFDGERLPW